MKHSVNFSLWFLLGLLCSSFASAEGWVDKQGNPYPDAPNMKSTENFVAQLVVTDNEKEALKNWGTPSESVYFPTAGRIERNRIISAFVVFGGCSVDSQGNCFLAMRMTVLKPDGSIYSEIPNMEVWENKPVPPDRSLGLSRDYMRVVIDDDDPLGEYTIEAVVEDLMSGIEVKLISKFEAVETGG